MIDISSITIMGPNKKPNPKAKCPRAKTMLKALKKLCNHKVKCTIPKKLVQLSTTECKGVKGLDIQMDCKPSRPMYTILVKVHILTSLLFLYSEQPWNNILF